MRAPLSSLARRLSSSVLVAAAVATTSAIATETRPAGDGATMSERPPLVPYWVFGHWIWEDEFHTRDAVEYVVSGYRVHGIPVSAVIFDSPWAATYNDFTWDPDHYPRPQDMIDDLHARGIRAVVFYTGAINRESNDTKKQKCDSYDLVRERGYAINGGRESKWWKGPALHVDFTNPEAVAWWHTQTAPIHAMGIDGAKIDAAHARFGKTIETSIGAMTNHEFGRHYFGRDFEYHLAQNPEFVAMTYAWSGMGLIGYPSLCHVNWVGDFQGDWQGMQDQRAAIYKSARDGFSAIACEIGGFWRVPSTKEQFIRYTQLSCFMPVMINGGQLGALEHHLPWKHDAETVAIYRRFVLLHTDLAPALFSAAVDVHERGGTLLNVVDADRGAHRLGPDLFAQPITSETNTATVTLPAGERWIDLWTGEAIDGGTTLERTCGLGDVPAFVRAGAIIPVGGRSGVFGGTDDGAAPPSRSTFAVYPAGKSQLTYHQPTGDGIGYRNVQVDVDGDAGTIRINAGHDDGFVFLVKRDTAPTVVTGADAWSFDSERRFLRIEKQGRDFEIRIE